MNLCSQWYAQRLASLRRKVRDLYPGKWKPGTDYDYWNTCMQEYEAAQQELICVEKESAAHEEFVRMETLQIILYLEARKKAKLEYHASLSKQYYRQTKEERGITIERLLDIEESVEEMARKIENLQRKLMEEATR